jgi:hypothetical protein
VVLAQRALPLTISRILKENDSISPKTIFEGLTSERRISMPPTSAGSTSLD